MNKIIFIQIAIKTISVEEDARIVIHTHTDGVISQSESFKMQSKQFPVEERLGNDFKVEVHSWARWSHYVGR